MAAILSPFTIFGGQRASSVFLPSAMLGMLAMLPLFGAMTAIADSAEAQDRIEFNRDIRPILAENCFTCHGPDKNRREADLRLDTANGIQSALTLDSPEESELLKRVLSDDADLKMPPPDSGKTIKPHELSLLQRWVREGATWEGHWAFQPIRRPKLPEFSELSTAEMAFLQNPIDRLVLEGIRRHALTPSPAADPITLARRLSFDLRGLPPSSDEVNQLSLDGGPESYERLVDQYLRSDQFGERMASWWLDLVRYADSVGYHGDQPVNVFPYREYVIRSFNTNKPLDQFTIEQLAGDLLPDERIELKIASGYNRLGMMSAEGGVQPKEYLAKYIAERVRNVSGTWLGLSLGCCECHDHKYDPFTMQDFYRLESFFADIEERGLYSGANANGDWGPRIQVPTAEQASRMQTLQQQLSDQQRLLDTTTPELAAAQSAWEKSVVPWIVLKPTAVASSADVQFSIKDDGSILASGSSPAQVDYQLTFDAVEGPITAIRLEVLPDDSLPMKGPGRAGNGNFVLTELLVKRPGDGETASTPVRLQNASASYEQTGAADNNPYGRWSAAAAIDGDKHGRGWGWAVMEQVGRPQNAVFETEQDFQIPAGTSWTVELQQQHESPQHTLGRFRISVTTATRPVRSGDVPSAEIAALIAIVPTERNDEQRNKLAAHYRSIAPALDGARQQLAKLKSERDALDAIVPTTLVTKSVVPRPIRILPRGNWMNDSGELCEPAFPEALPRDSAAANRMNRLDLAKWIVSRENPLTARNIMNRQWKIFFGAGLSRKLDDLGAQGEWPSHPELLDWRASDLIDSGWDLKRAIKQIVMSGTYRQTSHETPQLREIDPANRWLARQSRFRLDAEMVRDNSLAISGLLVEKLGGASVKPYQPPGYWAHLNFPTREWENGNGEDLYRRGIYTHWQRQYLHPSLMAFDAPSREECTADRARSNTPLQTLVLLNDPCYVEAARVFAQRLLAGESNDAERISHAVQLALSRPATQEETELLLNLLNAHRTEYRAETSAASELTSVGRAPVPDGLDRSELAAWTSVTRTLMCLHEAITRY